MRKYGKKLLTFLICASMFMQSSTMTSLAATPTDAAPENVETMSGLEELEGIEISDEEAEQLLNAPEPQAGINEITVQSRNWDQYGSDYIYNHYLNNQEKKFYDGMETVCKNYINTDVSALKYDADSYRMLQDISYEGMEYEDAKGMIYVFLFQNPQYYFVSSAFLYNKSKQIIWLMTYPEFADGAIRATETEKVFARTDSWIDEINQQATPLEKEKKAHDITCVNTTYDTNSTFNQSAYSLIMNGKTVCAGYAKTFSLLANAVGIDTIGVNGSNHGWNMSYIDGTWYNVDATWDDGSDAYIGYSFFNRSDSKIGSGHAPYAWFKDRIPAATKDRTTTYWSEDAVYVSQVTLDQSKVTMGTSGSVTLHASIQPENAVDKAICWTSSDENVASVSRTGIVTARSEGTATITATTNNKYKTAQCVVTVKTGASTPEPTPTPDPDPTPEPTPTPDPDPTPTPDPEPTPTPDPEPTPTPDPEPTPMPDPEPTPTPDPDPTPTPEPTPTPDPEPAPTTDATVTTSGIYVASHTHDKIVAGLVATPSKSADLEYRWLACDTSAETQSWFVIQDWTKNNQWLNWNPKVSGEYVIVGQVRVVGNESSQAQSSVGIPHHQQIKGKCQMPYTGVGGGYLIGIESYDNPNQEYSYELLVLDCTLLAQGKDAWIWSTGRCGAPDTSFWAVWQPQYGYYWTLFRVYDKDGTMIDQECYPFVNAY